MTVATSIGAGDSTSTFLVWIVRVIMRVVFTS